MNVRTEWLHRLKGLLPGHAILDTGEWIELCPPLAALRETAITLMEAGGCEFASLVAEAQDAGEGWVLRYFFYQPEAAILIAIHLPIAAGAVLPAISSPIHAAAWHEREIEDLFGIPFQGYPFLGDYVLHDSIWPENMAPMQREFDPHQPVTGSGIGPDWQPRRLLREEGAIAFPVGPIWADYNEAGLWVLETSGEQIYESQSRLFYKYRAVEKIAEGQTVGRVLLLAERFNGSAAFAHAYAYCRALEAFACCQVPQRAQALRAILAELERVRYHAATLAELAGSTSLAVGKSMLQEVEEQILCLSGQLCGHRYLFGLCIPGGLAWSPAPAELAVLYDDITEITKSLNRLERLLVHTSSFLDRIEEMGTLRPDVADLYGVVGPVARASARKIDLRRALPYGAYVNHVPVIPREIEGDGYARLRLYFAEIRASTTLIKTLLTQLPDGPVITECPMVAGSALGWVEAPAGGAFHWLHTNDAGRVLRWHIATPGARNWHAFHRALEGAAFQDFHIIMASFGLSVAESDR